MALFRKKPVIIEAMQFRFQDTGNDILAWANKGLSRSDSPHIEFNPDETGKTMLIHTLEGVMTVSDKDWVIKGVQGEFYPCKPDIFEATYEAV